jgi:hypothetical protein
MRVPAPVIKKPKIPQPTTAMLPSTLDPGGINRPYVPSPRPRFATGQLPKQSRVEQGKAKAQQSEAKRDMRGANRKIYRHDWRGEGASIRNLSFPHMAMPLCTLHGTPWQIIQRPRVYRAVAVSCLLQTKRAQQ